jgi:hypothetical protein
MGYRRKTVELDSGERNVLVGTIGLALAEINRVRRHGWSERDIKDYLGDETALRALRAKISGRPDSAEQERSAS